MRKCKMTDEQKKFAESRSHEASKVSYDLSKTIAQTCLIMNGGAATAILALLGKDNSPFKVATYLPTSLKWYVFGVGAAALMIFVTMLAADKWNHHWYSLAYSENREEADKAERRGIFWNGFGMICFWGSIIAFVVGGFYAAKALS